MERASSSLKLSIDSPNKIPSIICSTCDHKNCSVSWLFINNSCISPPQKQESMPRCIWLSFSMSVRCRLSLIICRDYSRQGRRSLKSIRKKHWEFVPSPQLPFQFFREKAQPRRCMMARWFVKTQTKGSNSMRTIQALTLHAHSLAHSLAHPVYLYWGTSLLNYKMKIILSIYI